MSQRPVSSNPPSNPSVLPNLRVSTLSEPAAASEDITVGIANCFPSAPSSGCVISSQDAYLDRSDTVNMFNGNAVDATHFASFRAYLQNRLGLRSEQSIRLLPMARFFDELDSAQSAITNQQFERALPHLQTASQIQTDNSYNATGALQSLLMAALSPALQAGSALEANRNPSPTEIRKVLGSVLFKSYTEIARFTRDNVLETPIKDRIDRLRGSVVTSGLSSVTRQAQALLRQRHPSQEELATASDTLRELVQQAENLRLSFNVAEVVVLVDRLNRKLPPATR